MSVLTAYRRYAPFKADQLVDAANTILSSVEAHGVTKRTLRFYTAQEVVPPPMGSPKFARYDYGHLLALLSARALQDRGKKLDQIRREVEDIRRGEFARLESVVENWLAQSRMPPPYSVTETSPSYTSEKLPESIRLGASVRRIALTPYATLEISEQAELKGELEAIVDVVKGLLADYGK